jgi:hypothetical protein
MKHVWMFASLILLLALAFVVGYSLCGGAKENGNYASADSVKALSEKISDVDKRLAALDKKISDSAVFPGAGTRGEKMIYRTPGASEAVEPSDPEIAPMSKDEAAESGKAPASPGEYAKQIDELKKEVKDLKARTPEMFMGGPGDFRKHRGEALQKKTEISDSVRDEIIKIWEEFEKKRHDIMKGVMAKVMKTADGEDTMVMKFPPDDPETQEKLKRIDEDEDNAIGRLLTQAQYEEYKQFKKEPLAFGFSVGAFGSSDEEPSENTSPPENK